MSESGTFVLFWTRSSKVDVTCFQNLIARDLQEQHSMLLLSVHLRTYVRVFVCSLLGSMCLHNQNYRVLLVSESRVSAFYSTSFRPLATETDLLLHWLIARSFCRFVFCFVLFSFTFSSEFISIPNTFSTATMSHWSMKFKLFCTLLVV